MSNDETGRDELDDAVHDPVGDDSGHADGRPDRTDDTAVALSRRAALASSAAVALGGLAGCTDDLVTPDGEGTADPGGGTATPTESGVGDIEHRALGDATIEMEDGSLVVRGVESEGDGVATLLGQAVEWASNTGTTISDMEDGATLRATAIGTVEGEADQMATTITMTQDGERTLLDWDYPVANGRVAVEVLGEDESVHYEEVGEEADLSFSPPGGEVMDTHIWFLGYVDEGGFLQERMDGVAPASCTYEFSNLSGDGLAVSLNGEEYTGTRLRVMEVAVEETADVWFTSEHRLTGSGVGSITMNTETVDPGVMFDWFSHEPIGDAAVERAPESVRVGGLEERDGVRIELGAVAGAAVPVDSLDVPDGTEFLVRGTLPAEDRGVGDKEPFGRLATRGANGDLELVADFEPLDTGSVRVEVARDGEAVESTTVEAGTLGTVGADVPVVETGISRGETPGLYHRFGDVAPVTLAADLEVEGDEVRAFASEPGGTVPAVASAELLGTGLEGIAITGVDPLI